MGKRKATEEASTSATKKARTDLTSATAAVEVILSSPTQFSMSTSERETRQLHVELASYARHLEAEVANHKPKQKLEEELNEAANKIRSAAHAGIQKLMTWKPSCKTGGAKWTYDGVCADPHVFAKLLKLSEPPTFKMKKYTSDEFEKIFGRLVGHARYSTLYLRRNVNVRWNPEEGTFKLSGSYGVFGG
ncbi:hypothetical protein AX16_002795 [Volvariella volvacea WC 439]|nr:hypothetical protein AX16_002795 [Volvariella volvacea WC 439]